MVLRSRPTPLELAGLARRLCSSDCSGVGVAAAAAGVAPVGAVAAVAGASVLATELLPVLPLVLLPFICCSIDSSCCAEPPP